MDEKQELLELTSRYLTKGATLDEISDWLVAHVEAIRETSPARELSDRLWILISEYDLGDRDEESVREELKALRVAA